MKYQTISTAITYLMLLAAILLFASCISTHRLPSSYMTYQQLTDSGYKCKPFEGKKYIIRYATNTRKK